MKALRLGRELVLCSMKVVIWPFMTGPAAIQSNAKGAPGSSSLLQSLHCLGQGIWGKAVRSLSHKHCVTYTQCRIHFWFALTRAKELVWSKLRYQLQDDPCQSSMLNIFCSTDWGKVCLNLTVKGMCFLLAVTSYGGNNCFSLLAFLDDVPSISDVV